MHLRRVAVISLAVLSLAAVLMLLAGPVAQPRPSRAYQSLPDLAIETYVLPGETDPLAPGNEITYGIYFINQGGYVASDVRIVAVLPEHTTYVSSSGPGFVLIQAGPDQVIWVRDRLSVFERGWLSVTVRVDDDAPVGAAVETGARILCLDPESDYGNNESIVKGYVLPAEPDLVVTEHLWQDSAPIAAGNEIVYEIATQNLSGSVASSVRITDTLPADCAYVSDNPADSGFATVQTGQTVVWTKAALATAKNSADSENLYIQCQIASDWTPDQWLENVVEISTPDVEYSYDNNKSRWVHKPEGDRRYGGAVTSVDDRTMRLLSDGGFDYALYYLDWSKAEPINNDYHWDDLDTAVWQAWRHNLRLVVRVDRAPAWARGPGTATAPPSNPDELRDFLQAAAGRWPRQPGNSEKAQIYGYVIWNEPNLAAEWGGNAPNAAAYTSLLQAAYNGVKAGSPDAWVISAGLASTSDDPPNAVDDRTYLQQMYTAGAASCFDYLGANPMGFASAPDDASDPNGLSFARAEEWRAIMEANGDGTKSMYGAEAGWLRDTPLDLGSSYNWMKVSEIDQAHYLARAYHKAQCEWTRSDGTPWMGPLTTWNVDFAAGNYSATDHPYWFGVSDENREPLRSYLTLQNAATRGPADLWLEKELVDPLELGQDIRYVIRYTNIGGQAATGVVMTDALPVGAEYLGDTGGGTLTAAGDQVVWSIGEVSTCTYETITLTLLLPDTAPAGGLVINSVEANTLPGEPYIDDNVATVITPIPGLGIHKAVTPGVAAPGQTITYTLNFSNTAQDAARDVFITDVVPVALASISYAHSGAVVTATGNVSYGWEVQDLTADEGGIITITGVIRSDVSGTFSLTNRAIITTTSADPYRQDNVSVVSSTIDAQAPKPPTLASPLDGTDTNDSTPTLAWNDSTSPDVAGYLLDFDGTLEDVGSTTQYTSAVLAEGIHTWTVAAYDVVGNTSAHADAWSFTVDTTAPAPPALEGPADGTLTSTTSVTLTWKASPGADVAGYLLDFDGSVQDVGNTTKSAMGPLIDGTYAWTVAAYDAAGNTGVYTDTWLFTVDAPPWPPPLASPADGTVTNTTSLTLTWRTSPSADVTGYLLDFDGVMQDVANTVRHSTGILTDGTYTWTIAAYDATGNTGAYTDTWSFAVDTVAPAPPTPAGPANGTLTDTTSLTLWWEASKSEDVTGYMVEFDGATMDVGSTAQFATGILADSVYTWRVAAYDAAGNTGAYAGAWSFTVDTAAPERPALVSPADGTHTTVRTPTLIWLPSPSADVAGYLLGLDGMVVDVGNVSQHTTGVLAYGTYDWSVAAYDALSHTSAYADPWTFATEPHRLYLPVVTRGYVLAPDLVVEQILVAGDDVRVIVRNKGRVAARDDFWVDVYIAPEPVPTRVNQIWSDLADEGLVWGVTTDVLPGEVLTLTVDGDYYAQDYSRVTWPLLAGAPVYAQVDSANADTTYGAVLEVHEITDGTYNNISGPVYPATASDEGAAEGHASENRWPLAAHRLPPRR